MKALSIRVYGRVQGVFFRASTRDKACQLSIKGWCQNEPDGSVLIHAEGSSAVLEEFVGWCSEGPPMARVDRLERSGADLSDFQGFEIRR